MAASEIDLLRARPTPFFYSTMGGPQIIVRHFMPFNLFVANWAGIRIASAYLVYMIFAILSPAIGYYCGTNKALM
jgi:hypothetical protein